MNLSKMVTRYNPLRQASPTPLSLARRGSSSDVMIEFNNVYKYYSRYHHLGAGIKHLLFRFPTVIKDMLTDRHLVLEGISFKIRRGECVGFFGRNGSGKSTTLGLIAGVLYPTAGSISVSGLVSPLLELGAGFHRDLTGRENIVLNGVLLGNLREEIAGKMEEIIAFSELGAFIDEPIRTYSSGMMTRLGFSVAIHLEPEILLLDEILAVGDIKFQQKCYKKIDDFRDRRVTIVLVSHNLPIMEQLCDRVFWIDDHKIRMVDSPEAVANAYYESEGISRAADRKVQPTFITNHLVSEA
jgi:homopolymeric O-antigen transport system ATP-binding protein